MVPGPPAPARRPVRVPGAISRTAARSWAPRSAAPQVLVIAAVVVVAVLVVFGGSSLFGTHGASDGVRVAAAPGAARGAAKSAPAAKRATATTSTTSVPGQLPASVTHDQTAPPAGATVIDPAHATRLLADLLPVRDRAQVAGDTAALRRVETATALAADVSTCACSSATTDAAKAGAGVDDLRSVASVATFVPRQTAYPASFLAQVVFTAPDGGRFREFLVMTRTDASRGWMIDFDTVTRVDPAPATLFPGAFDADGFARVPAPDRVDAPALLTRLAAQWQHQKDAGSAPSGSWFDPTSGSRFADALQDEVNPNGLVGHFSFRVDRRDPSYAYALDSGSPDAGAALVCGTIHIDTLWTAGPHGSPYQDAARGNWGPQVAPGAHRALVEHRIARPCLVFPGTPGALAGVLMGDVSRLGVEVAPR